MSNRPNKHPLADGKFETELLANERTLPRVGADQHRGNGLGICCRAIWALDSRLGLERQSADSTQIDRLISAARRNYDRSRRVTDGPCLLAVSHRQPCN